MGGKLELPVLQELGRVMWVVLAVYAVLRFEDLLHREALKLIFQQRYETSLFLLETTMGLLLPLALLLWRRIRESPGGLYLASVLVVLGFITNRLNVSITGMESAAGLHYIPKWTEIAITCAIIAAGFALFRVAAKYLPIFPAEELHTPLAPTLAQATLLGNTRV